MALFRSVMTAFSQRVCVCCVSIQCVCLCLRPFLQQACLKWFILASPLALLIWSGAKDANQSVSTPPENIALGLFPSELWCSS